MVHDQTNVQRSQDAGSPSEVEECRPHLVSPSLRYQLQRCYDHGMKLVREADGERYDYEYAHTMFLECVLSDPGNLVFVEAFLDNLQSKYGCNLRGSRLGGLGRRGALKKAVARGDWEQVLRLGPPLLYRNPWDLGVLRSMARACAAYRYNEPELRYLKNALDGRPRDVEVTRHCANSLTRMGQFDQAIRCWHRVEALRPDDREAAEMISSLTVEKQRVPAGFADTAPRPEAIGLASRGSLHPSPGVASRRAGPTPSASPDRAGQERSARAIPLTTRQRLEQASREEPGNVEHRVRLAEHHVSENRFHDAEQVLQKALSISGHDPAIHQRWEDVTILRMQQRLTIAEQRARDTQGADAEQLVADIREKLNRLELDVYDRRSQLAPQDQELRYELGIRLKRLGNYAQALACFQEASRDPRLRAKLAIAEGECLQFQRHYAKALRCYLQGVETSRADGDLPERKLALYRVGVLAMGLDQEDVARSHLEELVALEPGYPDARQRLDKLG